MSGRTQQRLARLMNITVGTGYESTGSQWLWRVPGGYLVSSSSNVMGEPEVYLFTADKDGHISDYRELEGSMRGTMDHKAVMRNAGFALGIDGQIKTSPEAGTLIVGCDSEDCRSSVAVIRLPDSHRDWPPKRFLCVPCNALKLSADKAGGSAK